MTNEAGEVVGVRVALVDLTPQTVTSWQTPKTTPPAGAAG
jgi:hypothetical protein